VTAELEECQPTSTRACAPLPRTESVGARAAIYDAQYPMGRMSFDVLATFAEFEVDLLSLRTCEGMAVARANAGLKVTAPKLSQAQQAPLLKQLETGEHIIPELAELFSVQPRDRLPGHLARRGRARPARRGGPLR